MVVIKNEKRFMRESLSRVTLANQALRQSKNGASRVCVGSRRRRGFWACWLRLGAGLAGFLQGFGEEVAVAGREGDAAEGGECWSDVGGRNGLEVLAGL